MKNNKNVQPTTSTKGIPRLKQSNYGEVLTSNQVLERLKEAENKKQKPLKSPSKKANKSIKKNKENLNPRKPELAEEEICQDSSGSDLETYQNSIISDTIPEVEYKHTEWNKMKPGIFILVDFLGGKRKTMHYKYV